MKKATGIFILVFALAFLHLTNALEIEILNPKNNSEFFIKPGEKGIDLIINASTSERALCEMVFGICEEKDGGIGQCFSDGKEEITKEPGLEHYAEEYIKNYKDLTIHELKIKCSNENDTSYKSVFFFFNTTCIPDLKQSLWSAWENYTECNKNDFKKEISYSTEYDANGCTQNKTLNKTREVSCDFCQQEIMGPFYTNWFSCSRSGDTQRTRYYIDKNFDSCCSKTRISLDCEIKTKYKNFTEYAKCEFPFQVSITSPKKGVTQEKRIYIEVNTSRAADLIEYIDYYRVPQWKVLCRNCTYAKRYETFADGPHALILRSFIPGHEEYTTVEFIVETKNPVIASVGPRGKSYTNGSNFYVKYTEENCNSITLYITESESNETIRVFNNSCNSGKNIGKNVSVDISIFNGKEIEYAFEVKDISGKVNKKSKPVRVIADTKEPIINSLQIIKVLKYYNFNLNITEENFYRAEYIDKNSPLPKWKLLCSSLKNNICSKRVFFSGKWEPDWEIRAIDKAGNSIYQEV
ncbi:MAG: hypothetical protein ACP5OG_06095 [Candidatus Nanoarchaeia archaeon]